MRDGWLARAKPVTREESGYLVGLAGVLLILVWLGIFKFTPTEAEAIRPLVASHPLMSWLYGIWSVQGVSNLVGIAELVVALALLLSLRYRLAGVYGGLGACIIFLMTLSFIFTLPGAWRWVDGMPIVDFFLLKDLVLLGVSLTVINRSRAL
ncbi:putative membrane protein YkgB [Aeromonas sp. BIGb0405]|jgi:reactive chlorine resistance protein C|nr:putative membrane protein YkgB [Aeromonas sp. BIGb0405]MCS3461094.1 putative membrane protein YkgB [Aeromonas sp. BIGb0445]